jgi:uncharacterized membrane protein
LSAPAIWATAARSGSGADRRLRGVHALKVFGDEEPLLRRQARVLHSLYFSLDQTRSSDSCSRRTRQRADPGTGRAPSAISYVVSFLVIMSFWMAHRAQFRAIANTNRRLSWLNGLFLMVVAFLPFSTGLFDRYPTEPLAMVIYAGSFALAKLMLTAIWWYASADPALLRGGIGPREIRFHRLNGLLVSLVFVLSISVAYFSVWAAVAVWVTLFVADHVLLRAFERSGSSRVPQRRGKEKADPLFEGKTPP